MDGSTIDAVWTVDSETGIEYLMSRGPDHEILAVRIAGRIIVLDRWGEDYGEVD